MVWAPWLALGVSHGDPIIMRKPTHCRGYEVFTGKSPINDQDKPALVAEAHTAIEFTFSSAIGKTYRIEDSLDLITWETVESGIAGNGAVIQRFYSTRGMPQRFFRVEQDGP